MSRANRNNDLDGQRRIAEMVAQQMAAAIPTVIANLQAIQPPPVAAHTPPPYNLKSFTGGNPPKYTGSDGATALLQWFEGVESVFSLTECPAPLQVKFAASLFSKRALTWWNKEKNTRGLAAAHAMVWADLKTAMLAEFCPRNELKKLEAEFNGLTQQGGNNTEYTARFHELSLLVPRLVTPESVAVERYLDGLPPKIRDMVLCSRTTTLEDTIRLAASLTDNLVKDGKLVRTSKKKREKKSEGKSEGKPESDSGKKGNKRRKGNKGQNFAATAPRPNNNQNNQVAPPQLPPPQQHYQQPQRQIQYQPQHPPQNQPQAQLNQALPRRGYTGPHPVCTVCTYHHLPGAACWKCTRCQRFGHLAAQCHTFPNIAQPQMNHQAPRQAGPQQPFVYAPPQQPPARGRAFQLNVNDAQANNDVVNGNA